MMVVFAKITPLIICCFEAREVVFASIIAIPAECDTFGIRRIFFSKKYKDWLSNERFYPNSYFGRFRDISNHKVCPGPSITVDLFCWTYFWVYYLYISKVAVELSIDLSAQFFEIILHAFKVFLVLLWNEINISLSILQGSFTHFCIFFKEFF